MSEVRIAEGESIETALKRFKKKIQKAGILSEIKRRERYEKPSDRERAKILIDFMRWALSDGQKLCAEMGYAPLPSSVVQMELEALKRIKLD